MKYFCGDDEASIIAEGMCLVSTAAKSGKNPDIFCRILIITRFYRFTTIFSPKADNLDKRNRVLFVEQPVHWNEKVCGIWGDFTGVPRHVAAHQVAPKWKPCSWLCSTNIWPVPSWLCGFCPCGQWLVACGLWLFRAFVASVPLRPTLPATFSQVKAHLAGVGSTYGSFPIPYASLSSGFALADFFFSCNSHCLQEKPSLFLHSTCFSQVNKILKGALSSQQFAWFVKFKIMKFYLYFWNTTNLRR